MGSTLYSSELIKNVESLLIKINIKRVDMYNIREIIDLTDEEFKVTDFRNLILDLRNVNYIDSTAIGGLLEIISRIIVPRKGRVVIISEKDQIHRKVASYYSKLFVVSLAETPEEAVEQLEKASAAKAKK
jgi:anti-anti-sigma factor